MSYNAINIFIYKIKKKDRCFGVLPQQRADATAERSGHNDSPQGPTIFIFPGVHSHPSLLRVSISNHQASHFLPLTATPRLEFTQGVVKFIP